MDAAQKKRSGRERRHNRIRKHVSGSGDRPRLAVFRSNRGIYAQVIDDAKGHTLAAASTQDPDLQAPQGDGMREGKIGASYAVGKLLAQRAQAAGVSKVVFDRGGNRYHGRVQALAEGAREGGLEF